jgi:hypothetical protein
MLPTDVLPAVFLSGPISVKRSNGDVESGYIKRGNVIKTNGKQVMVLLCSADEAAKDDEQYLGPWKYVSFDQLFELNPHLKVPESVLNFDKTSIVDEAEQKQYQIWWKSVVTGISPRPDSPRPPPRVVDTWSWA